MKEFVNVTTDNILKSALSSDNYKLEDHFGSSPLFSIELSPQISRDVGTTSRTCKMISVFYKLWLSLNPFYFMYIYAVALCQFCYESIFTCNFVGCSDPIVDLWGFKRLQTIQQEIKKFNQEIRKKMSFDRRVSWRISFYYHDSLLLMSTVYNCVLDSGLVLPHRSHMYYHLLPRFTENPDLPP